MKLNRKLFVLMSFSTLAFADISICFKKNHNDISTLETIKLDGGACLGKKNKQEMQKDGWKFENFQVKDDGYLFIFKKESQNIETTDVKSLKSTIIAEIKSEKENEIKKTKIKNKLSKIEKGETLYVNKCASCHGDKGNTHISNTTKLSTITLDEFKSSMKGYKIGSYNLGNASEMRPYSVGITSSDVKNIYVYLQNLNSK